MILCADPGRQVQAYRKDIDRAIERVLDSGWYVLGKETEAFEKEFAQYCGATHAIGVGSGTEALHLALAALDIGTGDEVITVSHTAVATVSAIELVGATPVLVDVTASTLTIDPKAVERAITSKTKAIIAVHLYGHPVDWDGVATLATDKGISLIEDCAQAPGARYQGRRIGSMGNVACFSFYPTKNLGAIGDGGAVVTSDGALAEKVNLLRQYGWKERYISHISGWNSRLDEMQAAILRVKLPHLDRDNKRRRMIAQQYGEAFSDLPVTLPAEAAGCESVFHLYVIRTEKRDALKAYLAERGVHTGIHYPEPVHLQPAYRSRTVTSLTETERAAQTILSLPMYPELTDHEVAQICKAVREFFENA